MNESKKEMLLTAQAEINVDRESGDTRSKIIVLTNFGIIECELDHRIKLSEIKEDKEYPMTQLAFAIDDDPGIDQNAETKIDKDCVLLKEAVIHSFSSSGTVTLGSVCLSVDSVQGVSIGRLSNNSQHFE
ncbi:hypothetical protein [Caproiciproducens faecalis]|uniref:Uncharacterized protein n=1 Tax=Caproiciproducens faecalis TaxID=2820301 RepID=A0ABS7DRE9_9FIRM|nr:hypothetical protein [Caproiciproducens faecalis]MBW7573883.1 hypothetical protein [Caproiciproducens faecalis]